MISAYPLAGLWLTGEKKIMQDSRPGRESLIIKQNLLIYKMF